MKEGDWRRERDGRGSQRLRMGDKFEMLDYTFYSCDEGVTSDSTGDIERLRNQ